LDYLSKIPNIIGAVIIGGVLGTILGLFGLIGGAVGGWFLGGIVGKKLLLVLILLLPAWGFLIRPPVNGGTVTSSYGLRMAHGRFFHNGTDIGLPTGSPVKSSSWGTVREAGFSEQRGNFVIIRHLPGTESRYLHLDSINVAKGQKVKPHAIIGAVGNTGLSTGSHLHFEIRLVGIPLPPYVLCLPGRIMQRFDIYKKFDSLVEQKRREEMNNG
jgi:murein DD-endopeptidase MepM/ murein hydrolase activator NlpD